MPKTEDPFLKTRDNVYERLRGFSMIDEDRRTAFQAEVQKILTASPANFYALGEMDYMLQPPDAGKRDWRRRDINRRVIVRTAQFTMRTGGQGLPSSSHLLPWPHQL